MSYNRNKGQFKETVDQYNNTHGNNILHVMVQVVHREISKTQQYAGMTVEERKETFIPQIRTSLTLLGISGEQLNDAVNFAKTLFD